MLEFPYLPERIRGRIPPSLSLNERYFWRPLVPIKVWCPSGLILRIDRALLDTGSLDTVLPLTVAETGGIALQPESGHVLRWRGTAYPLRFGPADLQLETPGAACRWIAIVGFSAAPLRYAILGIAGCLQFFDVVFRGELQIAEGKKRAKAAPSPMSSAATTSAR